MSEPKVAVPVQVEQCDRCGSSLTLMTACEQPKGGVSWSAHVDDTATFQPY